MGGLQKSSESNTRSNHCFIKIVSFFPLLEIYLEVKFKDISGRRI